MSRYFNRATGIALAATLMATLLGTSGSRAAAENTINSPLAGAIVSVLPVGNGALQPALVQTLPTPAVALSASAPTPPAIAASSLEQLVSTQADSAELSGEMKCLAGAIYFEARSESLEGQLAVGRVIVARTRSGRFPDSYCGVVYQPSQFSFIHRAGMPDVDAQSHLWHRAVALAKIADAGSWQSPAEGALFFHAARVSTGWRMKRVTRIDHHVFYR